MKVFLFALQNVIQTRGGVTEISEKTQKCRTSLYKTLSSKGNPYLKNINELMDAMDLHFAVIPNEKPKQSHGNEARDI